MMYRHRFSQTCCLRHGSGFNVYVLHRLDGRLVFFLWELSTLCTTLAFCSITQNRFILRSFNCIAKAACVLWHSSAATFLLQLTLLQQDFDVPCCLTLLNVFLQLNVHFASLRSELFKRKPYFLLGASNALREHLSVPSTLQRKTRFSSALKRTRALRFPLQSTVFAIGFKLSRALAFLPLHTAKQFFYTASRFRGLAFFVLWSTWFIFLWIFLLNNTAYKIL